MGQVEFSEVRGRGGGGGGVRPQAGGKESSRGRVLGRTRVQGKQR